MTTASNTDRIEKKVFIKAPRARVWRAISDTKEFGAWFRCELEGAFIAGATVRGRITYPGYEHLTMEVVVETVDPERCLAFRWHPNAVDASADYSHEPMTLVEFTLQEKDGGTELTIVESGFDKLPAARREQAFRSNEGGWTEQLKNVGSYVSTG